MTETYSALVVGDDERSTEPFGMRDLILVAVDFSDAFPRLRVPVGLELVGEVRVLQEVAVALDLAVSQLIEDQSSRTKIILQNSNTPIEIGTYLDKDGVLIDALDNDTALQFNHSILLLKIVNASC